MSEFKLSWRGEVESIAPEGVTVVRSPVPYPDVGAGDTQMKALHDLNDRLNLAIAELVRKRAIVERALTTGRDHA